jgi:anaerobic ribonucleoside-triphosphate reductase
MIKSIDKTSIRTLINAQFIKRGMLKEEEQNRKLGLSVRDFEELIHKGCKDNANMLYNPEMIAKYCFDSIAKEDALLKQPAQCREAFEGYYIHEHDQESQELRSNCFNIDIRWIAKNGLDMDGNRTVATSKPAKSLYTLLRHMTEFFMACSCVFSGGLGYPYFNVFLAPYCKGMSYRDIKQSLQMFIFDVNQSLVSRGGQICFTSVGLEFKVPEWLRDVPAIAPAGVPIGTYKDYESEAELLLRAYMEIKMEGDSLGRPFRFPNDIFTIREGVLDEYKGNIKLAHEYIAKFPTPYFLNSTHDERVAMGCLDGNEGIWCKINNNIVYKTFYELSDMLNADYGVTPVDNLEVLTLDDNKNIIWHKVSNFIKNKDQQMYKITLNGNKSFICDESHGMITFEELNKRPILNCTSGIKLIDVNCKNVNVDFDTDYKSILMGFWLGDGEKNVNYGRIIVSKEDKKDFLESIFQKANIEYSLNYRTRNTDNKHINPDIYEFKFKKSDLNDLEINNFDLNDINVCAGLLSGMLSSDGYVRTSGTYKKSLCAEFVSTKLSISNLFKYCCFMTGLKFSSRILEKQKSNHNDFERVYISCNKSTIHSLKQLYLRRKQIEIINQFDEKDFRNIKVYKSQYVLNIEPLDKRDSFCLEVNGRMIMGSDFILTSQCRTTNIDNWTGNKEKDLLNTGNFMYTSLNLPLIIMDNKDNWREAIKYYCDVSRDYLLYRKGQIEKRLYDDHLLDLLLSKDCETGEQLYDLDRLSYTIGYVGLNEAILTLTDGKEDILSNKELGKEILDIMNEKCKEYKEKDHLRWAVFSSPAESTAYKFGEYNKRKYPNAYVQGTKDHYYLTNSHHIRVSDTSNIIEHIRNGDYFHPLSLGGCIEHLWIGDTYIDSESLFSLTKKIAKTNVNYFDYDAAFSSCSSCGFSNTEIFSECPICESDDVITYDRCFSGDTVVTLKNKENDKLSSKTLKQLSEMDYTQYMTQSYDFREGKYVWSNIKRVINNPPEKMIHIHFNNGYEVTCTPNHEFYKVTSNIKQNKEYDKIAVKDFKIGTQIINHIDFIDVDDNNRMSDIAEICTVDYLAEAPEEKSYCLEVDNDGHNAIFNGVLAKNCTGYYVPVKGFNKGKKQEFKDRYRHTFKKEKGNEL